MTGAGLTRRGRLESCTFPELPTIPALPTVPADPGRPHPALRAVSPQAAGLDVQGSYVQAEKLLLGFQAFHGLQGEGIPSV